MTGKIVAFEPAPMTRRRLIVDAALAATCAIARSNPAAAQAFPLRPITIVVPFAAGGPIDTLARVMAERMRAPLGQPVVIENVTGAAGSIGVGRVARAAPDGYTLVAGFWGTHVVNGATQTLAYDVLNDFEPVLLTSNNVNLIVGRKTLPADDLKGLIAWLKANPDTAAAGTAGVGSPQQIHGVFFQKATGTRFRFVPYRGGAPAMQDLVAGQIDLIFADQTTSLPQVRGGNIKAFAVMGKSRLASAPAIPTVDEAGLPGFYCSVWNALFAPKGTPRDIIAKLNAAAVDALAESAVRERLAGLGQQIVSRGEQTPEALAAFHKAEIEKWWPIIKAAGIRAE
ncbi:MAG TPA: tripartite tricarboxylate transporter substrate-binding protein [Xanthobacteraceae bacterium]|jgi:tripartite-type tricarboxylate transporter receptor subunit TctC|nr:tripartite tricarboxylate transporter substrate-binding protein [Xanthobacteraceae bacterium]